VSEVILYFILSLLVVYYTIKRNNGLFLDKVSQHGSNMVMTNVSKPTKQKFLNIDTTFSDDLTLLETTTKPTPSFTIPEKTRRKTVKVA
jgi:hypothetical protein